MQRLDDETQRRYLLEKHPYDILCFCTECDRQRVKQLRAYWHMPTDEQRRTFLAMKQLYRNNEE